jgi:hypothetical protein
MAKDKNVELKRKAYYLENTKWRKKLRKDIRAINKSNRLHEKECPDCGGMMIWCCDMWSRVCCYDYGTCPCS